MSYTRQRQAERELDTLQREHDDSTDPDERRALRAAMRDIERDLADEERWREEGAERGYL